VRDVEACIGKFLAACAFVAAFWGRLVIVEAVCDVVVTSTAGLGFAVKFTPLRTSCLLVAGCGSH